MRIIISMCYMTARTGAELFVRDLALSLNEKGHSIIVFSPIMGDMVDELKMQSIECITDLASIDYQPEVIIGNTQYETVACLARFPGVPAISICHDSHAAHGSPPRFSRILSYVAVDKNCSERLQRELNLSEMDISIIQNGVDLRRFQPRAMLPTRPLTAVIFSNYATQSLETQMVQSVCSELNIDLDIIGSGVNKQSKNPEKILIKYDLVFAKARCAMEAMVVGCAVILLNENMGMAGLVTSKNVKEWHPWNFGRRLLQQPINAHNLREAIRGYSAEDAAIVSRYMRENATLRKMTDSFENIAQTVIDAARTKEISSSQENKEFARFIVEKLSSQSIVSYETLEAELKHACDSLHSILQSNSWRITKPLRSLVDFFKKRFK